MSDDITQRLRAAVPKMPESGTPIAWPVKVRSELLLEAAAQIERLRADLALEIDPLIRKRMAEAWEEGWFDRDCQEADWDKNPYRGRTEK